MELEVGNLVTWVVDYEEFLSKSKAQNSELEIGLIVEKKNDPSHDDIHDQIELIRVFWFNNDLKSGWVPINNLVNLSGENNANN